MTLHTILEISKKYINCQKITLCQANFKIDLLKLFGNIYVKKFSVISELDSQNCSMNGASGAKFK